MKINKLACSPLNAKCCMWVWNLAEKCEIHSFLCQTIPSWLHISGAKVYYSPTCNLNLLNCLQTHLFHVTQWEKSQCFGSNYVSLFFFSIQNTTSFGVASLLFHGNLGQEHLLKKTLYCSFVVFFFLETFAIFSCRWCGFQTHDIVTFKILFGMAVRRN